MIVKRAQKTRRRNWLSNLPLFSLRGLPEIVASSGISVRLWRVYAQAWLFCLIFPILFLVQTPLAPLQLLIALAGLVVFVAVYTWFMWPHPLINQSRTRNGFGTSLMVLAGQMAVVIYLSLAYGSAFLWLFVGISAIIGITLPAFSAFLTILALTLFTLGLSIWISGGIANVDWLHILPLVLLVRGLGLDMIGVARLSDALRELHAVREELARQAVMEERLRLALDLHDLLGHTLSMITLKSELAGRLIEKEPARAVQEIQEVESAARQALREVREAVAGYRQPTLRGELDSARQILDAAGITYMIESDLEALPPAIDAVLAWAVREGVTNVIRHSRARRCHIQISNQNGSIRVEMINDGYRERDLNTQPTRIGSGLSGLRERVSKQGGQVEAGPFLFEGHPGYRLQAELPLRSM